MARSNYHVASASLGLPLEAEPELLEQVEHAAQSAVVGLGGLHEESDWRAISQKRLSEVE